MKKGPRKNILFFLIFILLSQGVLYAQYFETIAQLKGLDLKIDTLRYHPNYDSSFKEAFRIEGEVSNTTIPVDWVVIAFGTGDAGIFNPRSMYLSGNNLDYQLYDSISSGNILLDYNAASSLDDLIVINVGGKTGYFREKTSFEIEIPSGQFVPSGLYKDQPIAVELWGLLDLTGTGPQTTLSIADLANMELLDSLNFKIHTNASDVIRSAIVEKNGAFDFNSLPYKINFGTLTSGDIEEADLVIEATSSYSVDVESLRGNRLKHTKVAEYVNYTFTFDGSPVTLPAGATVNLVTNTPASFSPGDRYPMEIQIEATIGFVPAGSYKDILSFTITAN